MTPPRLLIESCMEGGPLPEEKIREALAGQVRQPLAAAILSWLEFSIGTQRQIAETRGQDPQLRTEANGAATALVDLRATLLEMLRVGTDQAENAR